MKRSARDIFISVFFLFAGLQAGLLTGQEAGSAIKQLSPLQQVYLLKQIKPDIKRIGILCNLENRAALPKTLSRISAQFKIKIILYDTRKKQNLAKNFKALVKKEKADAIWVFPDEVLNYKSATQYLIKQAVTSKIILVTHDPEQVKKGATLAARIENGDMKVYINQKAADMLGLHPGEQLSNSASIVMN